MDFTGKSIVVTGASVGMGRDAAIQFAARGGGVIVNYASAEKDAAGTVAAIVKAGGTAVPCRGDVSREEDAENIVATAIREFGRLDVLVNNAGITRFIPFDSLEEATPEVWMRLYSVNVVGAFLMARAAAREMRKTGGGAIINIASIAGHRPGGSSIPYCSSKAALLHMTECLAKALGPDIRVNSVSPGAIDDTRWNAGRADYDADAAFAELAANTPLKRNGHATDITETILFLASDAASFITGTDLLVDGGRSCTS